MNAWGNEQFVMPNLMGMTPMMQNVMSSNTMSPNTMPLLPPLCMMADLNGMTNTNQSNNQELRRPFGENEQDIQNNVMFDDSKRDRDRSKDRNRRPRSRERIDRFDRNKFGIDKNHGERRRTKWDTNDKLNNGIGMENMMVQGNMIPYNNIVGQPMDMANMQNLANMQSIANVNNNISSIANIPGMLPVMTGIMDQNIMMMHQAMTSQPIFLKNAILLPPNPNAVMTQRREKPYGCRTIFVGGLPNGVSEEIVREIFERFGAVCDIKWHKQGVCHVRFDRMECVEQSFPVSGFRFKYHEQMDAEATTVFIDYALNRDDQSEYERNKRKRDPTPPRIEPYTYAALSSIGEKIKSDTEFIEAAPTLVGWLERGECNKRNANSFYSLVQATNNQIRRLFNEKMQIEEEFQAAKTNIKDKFFHVLTQFEQVAKVLNAAKHQRVSDHFTKQQRRNIDMWLKMTEELENIKEEFNSNFDEDDAEKGGKHTISLEKYQRLMTEKENLTYELEGYKNEAHLAKNEAERKFEVFKAHFIAQQALQNKKGQQYPSLPVSPYKETETKPPLTSADVKKAHIGKSISSSEAKLISLLTAFLMVHPLGATLDYLVSYIKSILPDITQNTVNHVLQSYTDVFRRKTNGVGANIEHRWYFVTYESIKSWEIKNEPISVIID